jgi:Tfp pilus assembly protein PilN
VQPLKVIFSSVDVQLVFYIVLALIPNLFLILWAMARLSRDVRLLKAKLDMTENDINLLDQSISSLTAEFQAIRKLENEANAASEKAVRAKTAGRPE